MGGFLVAATSAYLSALLVAAALARARRRVASGASGTSFVVLVPAHNEEATVAATVRSLFAAHYPADLLRVVVIADNCSDETATAAAQAGAIVWERHDVDRPGKGRALEWALERLSTAEMSADAVAIVDADCTVTPNFLSAIDQRLATGAAIVQTDYVVSNPGDSPAAALRFAGFALMNTVRGLGKTVLGLSSGLFGTGMAFTFRTLQEVPWSAFSAGSAFAHLSAALNEDVEQHLRFVSSGKRAVFAPEAAVSSPMPTSLSALGEQQARWESGRLRLVRVWTPELVRDGLRHRDAVRMHAGLELLVPPQAILLAASMIVGVLGALTRSRPAMVLAAAATVAQATFVVGGLLVARAPSAVYRALLHAPFFLAMKLRLYIRLGGGRFTPAALARPERNDHGG